MIINDAGEYTLKYTATDACGNSTVVERGLTVNAPPYYGALWDFGAILPSQQMTRTGLSANFADPQAAVNNGSGSSPFDNIMPWSGMQIVEDAEAGTLVSIPKFYYQWVRGDTSMEIRISNEPLDGFHVSPAHADRGDGVGERDVVYVGRYHSALSTFKSTSGVSPDYEETRATFRTRIHNVGADIWQYDFAMYWTIRILYLVEYANWSTYATIGEGCRDSSSSRVNNGTTDAMQYHTGTTASAKDIPGYVQYRHIEDLWANVADWVDGIYFNNDSIYAINNPSDFSDNSNGTLIGIRPLSSNFICGFTNPNVTGYEYALFPNNVSNNSVFDTLCSNSAGTVLFSGGNYNVTAGYYGLFYLDSTLTASSSKKYVGCRLMKLPSA